MRTPFGRPVPPHAVHDHRPGTTNPPAEPLEVIDWVGLEQRGEGPAEFTAQDVGGHRRRRFTATAIALGIVVVGLVGLVGDRDTTGRGGRTPAAAPSEDAALPGFQMTSPEDGAAIDGGVVRVAGISTARMRLQGGGFVGDTALGLTTAEVFGAEAVTPDGGLFAPPVGMDVDLVAEPLRPGAAELTPLGLARGGTIRRPLVARPAGPVAFWPPQVMASRRGTVVFVAGCAPLSLHQVSVR